MMVFVLLVAASILVLIHIGRQRRFSRHWCAFGIPLAHPKVLKSAAYLAMASNAIAYTVVAHAVF